MDTRPYYVRTLPSPQDPKSFATDRIDFSNCHLPAYPQAEASGALPDSRLLANSLFDARAAAVVSAAIGDPTKVTLLPQSGDASDFNALLEWKGYGVSAPLIVIPTAKCLAAMAYKDYFPDAPQGDQLRQMVSDAIMAASPGWCGTFGPKVNAWAQDDNDAGNYDMTQMWLLPLAYAYYDLLSPDAREKLITGLLAKGTIRRSALDDTFTSGEAPNDWDRAGRVAPAGVTLGSVPETENHVLMIATVRYLTNQLLYPRALGQTPLSVPLWPLYDNRRNSNPGNGQPSCMAQVLQLLRNKLLDDFAEYNAKPYQEETRNALLNLFSYAYDAEVRLAAGMVLDYISAHIAVSSCDLRRMVPFRRRDEDPYQHQDSTDSGFMDVSLLDAQDTQTKAHGADPMAGHFVIHAGNTRAYQLPDTRVWPGDSQPARPWFWGIPATGAPQLFLEAVCDHRLAPSVHDLFVNDLHRRLYQRLHRIPMVEPGNQRNCDNMEIYSGSPSYLITAGGEPATWVIPGRNTAIGPEGFEQQNLGVALPISFMPVSISVGAGVSTSDSRQLIQILHFSDVPRGAQPVPDTGGTENYGVAPDFACGVFSHFPSWTGLQTSGDGVHFIDMHAAPLQPTLRTLFGLLGIPVENGVRSLAEQFGLTAPISVRLLIDAMCVTPPAGFYLAIHKQGVFCILEAFDTWRHPEVKCEAFQNQVKLNNPDVTFASGQKSIYTTYSGNRIHYAIWQNLEVDNYTYGSKILAIEYGSGDPSDTLADAGNDTNPFLSGTILKSQGDGKVEIHNPSLNTILTLDWSDPQHLVRISENGEMQQAGAGYEVWVDFDWTGPSAGDFYQPFNTLEAALNAVAQGGVIRIMTGSHHERLTIDKRVTLKAAGGAVTLSAH